MSFRKLHLKRRRIAVAALLIGSVGLTGAANADGFGPPGGGHQPSAPTSTPVKHLVVIFQENVSFDHYFGTYPTAINPAGEPSFNAAPGTPAVNGCGPALLDRQPEPVQPAAPRPRPGADLRPGPRLHGRAAGLRPRPDGHVRPEHRATA